MRQNARQRREAILAELIDYHEVTASDLAEKLAVSQATVRRDLHALADEGQVELSYGGATLPKHSDFSYRAKALRNPEAKRVIGRLAAEFVEDGDQIFVDSGTTCYEMAPGLMRKRGLSVLVNSARLALELDSPNLEVILLGGQYRPDRMDTVGPLASAALDQLRGYAAFLGADGLSQDFGLTAGDVESAFLFRQAVANARECNLLVDHSKFRTPSLCRIVQWDAITRVLTDQPPEPDWAAFFRERSIEVLTPPPRQQAEAG